MVVSSVTLSTNDGYVHSGDRVGRSGMHVAGGGSDFGILQLSLSPSRFGVDFSRFSHAVGHALSFEFSDENALVKWDVRRSR